MAFHVIYHDLSGKALQDHIFPVEKYRLVHEQLLADGIVSPETLKSPETLATEADLLLAHTRSYVERVRRIARENPLAGLVEIEAPIDATVIDAFSAMTAGTQLAARKVFGTHDCAFHIGGGFHHAFADRGEGFCLFNDVAVAARMLQKDHGARQLAVLDLDVHQGNGTAHIFLDDPSVFTCSLHDEDNYPIKQRSDLDIGLAAGCDDATYLAELDRALPEVLRVKPELLFYLAGADPYREDQLGNLALTLEGLARRDRRVLQTARQAGLPVVICLAGGYARRTEDVVTIHTTTARIAHELYAGTASTPR